MAVFDNHHLFAGFFQEGYPKVIPEHKDLLPGAKSITQKWNNYDDSSEHSLNWQNITSKKGKLENGQKAFVWLEQEMNFSYKPASNNNK